VHSYLIGNREKSPKLCQNEMDSSPKNENSVIIYSPSGCYKPL